MAALEPYAGYRLNSWRRIAARIQRPGVLFIIITTSTVLIWRTFFMYSPSITLSALVVTQMLLLLCSYWFPIASAIFCCALILVTDSISSYYSSYALYPLLAVLGLWAYRTNDAASVGATVMLSLYQLVWVWKSQPADVHSVPLFVVMFCLTAALGAALRHGMDNLREQRLKLERMRISICRTANELHDAVSGELTQADLLLQEQELLPGMVPESSDREKVLAVNHEVRQRLDTAASGVAEIVDLLLSQYGEQRTAGNDSDEIARLREQMACDDAVARGRGIQSFSNVLIETSIDRSVDFAVRRTRQNLRLFMHEVLLPHARKYEISVSISEGGASVTCLAHWTKETAGNSDFIQAWQSNMGRCGEMCDVTVRDDVCEVYMTVSSAKFPIVKKIHEITGINIWRR